jgi:hypothetical protein
MHWRCWIGPAIFFHRNHGAILSDIATQVEGEERSQAAQLLARYTSGQDNHYFDWRDAEKDDARLLAAMFVSRFTLLARLGQGWDYAYAGWFQRLVGLAELGWLPVVLSDSAPVLFDHVPLLDVRTKQQQESNEEKQPTLTAPPAGLLRQDYGAYS